MEEDKKRKKNKKKKNKQNKATENSADGAGEHIISCQKHVDETGKNTAQVREPTDAQNDVVPMRGADQLRHVANGPEVSTFAEAEKKHLWLEREASLKGKIKQLQEEMDARIQKEGILEEKIQQLLMEKDVTIAKERNLLEQIKQLQGEKVAYSLKQIFITIMLMQASLEQRISQLEKEKDAYERKESSLEEEIARLHSEKEVHVQKGIQLEEKINHVADEAANLSLEKNSNKEIVTILNVDNSRLQAQVLQLEQSRNSLLEENQQLRETISGLRSQILNFKGNVASSYSSTEGKMQTIENGDMASQIEAAHMLVEKLITENAELVEKVNELYVELNRRSLQKEISSENGAPRTAESAVADNSADLLDLKVESDERRKFAPTADLMLETGAKMFVSGEMVQTENVVNKNERNNEYMGATHAGVFSNSPEMIDSDEIVQIPLDENGRQLMDLEAGNNSERAEVPIADAPFIGAPFRIISFVARYVSGADLVDNNSVTAG